MKQPIAIIPMAALLLAVSVVTSGCRAILKEKQHETTHCNRGPAANRYRWLTSGGRGARPTAPSSYGNVDIRGVNLAFRVGGRVDQVLVVRGIA